MELVAFIGLQASGKSTFYRRRFAKTHVHVSKDLMPRSARNKARRQSEQIARAFREGQSVVVDNTNVRKEDRAELIARAKEHQAKAIGYYFEATVDGCLERNARRSGAAQVPDVAIFATAKKLEPPTIEEGFDELYRVRLRSEDGFEVEPVES